MKLSVDCNFRIRNVLEPPVELSFEGEEVMLKDVMSALASRCGNIEFLKKDEELGLDVDEIFINEKSVLASRRALQIHLKDGDRVKVKLAMDFLGGG